MASIKVIKGYVDITETTVKELLFAIEEAKQCSNLDCIEVTSEFSNVNFIVSLEKIQNTQESLGYRFNFSENEK